MVQQLVYAYPPAPVVYSSPPPPPPPAAYRISASARGLRVSSAGLQIRDIRGLCIEGCITGPYVR